jgi:hypothetical protein
VASFSPITSERTLRKFGVLDLEWVPGEVLPSLVSTKLEIEGITRPLTITLPPTKKRTKPLQLRLAGYYDQVSTDDVEGEPVMAERYRHFLTAAELIEFMFTRENRGMWFFAHAGGLSDMEFVLDELLNQIKESLTSGSRTQVVYDADGQKREETIVASGGEDEHKETWNIKASFSGSSAIIVHISKGKDTWHCVDSYWLFRDKLSKIGESIGIKKMDEEKRRTPEETRRYYAETPLDVLIPYNKVDCEILWKAISEFEKEIVTLGGQLQQTIASTAMNLFRRSYLKQTIHTAEVANRLAMKGYFASRVEVFDRHVEDFKIYDINSSFPYSMTFPLPGNLLAMGTSLPKEESDSCLYMADATIEVPEMDVPPLPFRTLDDQRVFFPTGKWRSWFMSTDINLAKREGCKIHKVHECYQYEPFFDFAQYAKEIYELRKNATTPFRKLLLKYLLNSLYGKAAESLLKQEMLINPDEEDLDREELQMLQPGVWLREKEVAIAHRHVIVSAIITALSRRHLYDYIKESHEQQQKVFYVDTDSVATKADLKVGEELGQLKLEKKMDWAEFVAPKIYRGEGHELKDGAWKKVKLAKAKGFSLNRFDNPIEALGKIIGGEQIGVQSMVRMRELYRSEMLGGSEPSSSTSIETVPYEQLVIKALTSRMLSKRYQYPDGGTRAWRVDEILSGDCQAKGFDFPDEFLENLDPTTRALLAASV